MVDIFQIKIKKYEKLRVDTLELIFNFQRYEYIIARAFIS